MKNDLPVSQVELFELIHEAVGYARPPAQGATASMWLTIGKELVTYREQTDFDSKFFEIVKDEFGIGKDPARAILTLMNNEANIEKLALIAPDNRYSYSWVEAFAKAPPEVVDKVCVEILKGNHLSYKDINRLAALVSGNDLSRRNRLANRLKKNGIESSDQKVADALIVAAQSVADAMAEFDSIAAGKLDKSGMLAEEDAKAEMKKQIQSVKDRLLVSSGGRSKVRVNPAKQSVEVSFRPLRSAHPMTINLEVKWGAKQ